MPLYVYCCTQCGHNFEKIQRFRSKPERVCPKCQGVVERVLTAPALKFKGAGFYVNDYAGKSAAPASEPAPAEVKTPCGGSCGAACPAVAAASSSTTGDSSKK